MHPARLALLLGAVFASAGCEQAEAPPAPAPAPAGPAFEPRQDLPEETRALDLFGAWLVTSVRAPAPVQWEQGHQTLLLAGSRQLEILSQCVRIGPFTYGRLDRDGIAISQSEPTVAPAPDRDVPPPVQCTRTLSPMESILPRILLTAERVVRQADGSVLLSGQAGALVLRRPDGALANPRGEAPPPERPPLIGAWRFVEVNERPLPAGGAIELLLRPPIIEWRSGCVNEARMLMVDGDRLLPGPVDPFPVCERGRDETELAIGRMTSGPIVTRMQRNGRLSLSGSGVTAELVPLTS
jgi:hypothetical protein